MVTIRSILRIAALAAVSSACWATDFTFDLAPGPNPVGFRVVLQYDYSRTFRGPIDVTGKPYTGERARPIQTLIWYPAEPGGKAMTMGDYVDLFATETDFAPSPEKAKALIAIGTRTEGYDGLDTTAKAKAARDARAKPGKYPVVIYAPGAPDPAFQNADFCEYLASFGYIVIASPDMGAHSRAMTIDLEGTEAQAGDISFLIGFARSLPEVDMSQVGVVGYSWGGLSNLLVAARDSRVKALVSWDGSARYYPKLAEEAKYLRPENLNLPLIFFTQAEIPIESLGTTTTESKSVLNRMTNSDVMFVRMHAMTHQNFGAMDNRSSYWRRSRSDDFTDGELSQSYGWVVRYTERFLAAKLKQDAGAAVFLKATPAANGVGPHLMTIQRNPAKGAPVSFETLVSEVKAKGFSKVGEVYQEFRARDKTFELSAARIKDWGNDLLAQGSAGEAIEVFKFNLSLSPKDAVAQYYLAGVYDVLGQSELALQAYEKTIELAPYLGVYVRDHIARLREALKVSR